LSVYDEGLCEVLKGKADLKAFTKIMCEQPGWAPGLPLKAKGWIGARYRK